MDTSVENGLVTRSDRPLRVIASAKSPEAIKSRIRRSFRQIRTENVFKRTLVIMGLVMVVLVLGILLTLIVQSLPSIRLMGLKYHWGKTWDPVKNIYGAFPFLLGTLLTSFLALLISIP